MDLISKYSPSSSVSPPISPIKLFSQPSASLPPLKNLPVWNRPGLEKNRFIRSIAKDSPELEKAELLLNHFTSRSTQTTPPGTAVNNSVGFPLSKKEQDASINNGSRENSTKFSDKRLYFVQTEHENVLRKLHSEIERLKNENKELTFKFVMTNNGLCISPDNKDQRHSAGSSKVSRKSSGMRKGSAARPSENNGGSFSKEGLNNRKPMFRPGGNRNPVLETKKLHRLKSGSKSAKFTDSAKKTTLENQQSLKHNKQDATIQSTESIQNVKQNVSSVHQLERKEVSSAVQVTGEKKYSSEDYEEIIRGLQRMNARQAHELSHLRDKLVEQKARPVPEELQLHSENRLPKLAIRSTIKSAKMPPAFGEKHDIVTLPALRPHRLANRQRKAQAAHLQRQKMNKEFVQKFA